MKKTTLLFPILAVSASIDLAVPPSNFVKSPEIRNIYLSFKRSFPNSSSISNSKHIKWLYSYGNVKHFPHCQKLILETVSEFSIFNIGRDPKIVESVELFYGTLESEYHLLKSFEDLFRLQIGDTISYLIESGFPPFEYSFNELIDLFSPSSLSGLEYSEFITNPKFHDLIRDWPEIALEILNAGLVREVFQLYCQGNVPVSLLLEMVMDMGISDLSTFSKLPHFTNDKTRSILLPLFNQYQSFSKMPNTFKVLSKYPHAVRCLEIVQGPDKFRKQVLIILFPYHVNSSACDDIINLDLREKVGGWRRELYEKRDYFAVWPGLRRLFEELALVKNVELKDRIVLDSLWVEKFRFDPDLVGAYGKLCFKVESLIVKEEGQSLIYQLLATEPERSLIKNYNDEIIPDLEKGIWEEFIKYYEGFDSLVTEFLQISLIPRLFPSSTSRVVLAAVLDVSLLRALLLEKGRDEVLKHTIKALNELFEIEIDPTSLADLDCSDFESFTTFVYERVNDDYINSIGMGKLMRLYNKNTIPQYRKLLLDTIVLRISRAYSKNDTQNLLIKKLISHQFYHNISYDKLGSIGDVPEYLNFLYLSIHPVLFFKESVMEESFNSNVNRIATSERFGYDFLHDIAKLAPDIGY